MKVFSVIALLVILVACKKEDLVKGTVVSEIITENEIRIEDTLVTFYGKLSNFDFSGIDEIGFVLGLQFNPDTDCYRIIANLNPVDSTFYATCSVDLIPIDTIRVRAYASVEDSLLYGNNVSFIRQLSQSETGEFVNFYGFGIDPDQQYWHIFSFSLGETGYIGFQTGSYVGKLISFNPNTPSWKIEDDNNEMIRLAAFGAEINGTGYVFSGNCFHKFDPQTNTFTALTPYGGGMRFNSVGFCFNNLLFIGLGAVDGLESNDFWEYNPEHDSWKRLDDFPGEGVQNLIAYSTNEKIYIGGGYRLWDHYRQFWEYDITKDKWWPKSDLPVKVYHYNCSCFNYNENLYLYFENNLWKYYPNFDAWSQVNTLEISWPTASFEVSIADQVYLGEYYYGYNGEHLKTWKYFE